LPLVLALAVGLLLSLFHCASCDMTFAGSGSATIAANLDTSTSHDVPEQQLPGHSGHCLGHVTAQPAAVTPTPADVSHRPYMIGCEQSPASLAGLPLFKPPRA
jgi:hypothetical protein